MADSLERTTNLLALLLEARRPLTLDQISSELAGQYPQNKVAARGAFERDKATLRDVGVPLDTVVLGGDVAGQTGYSIDRANYELAGLDLEPDERRALQLAVAAARSADGQFGLLKLGGAAGQQTSLVANVPDLVSLPPLHTAVTQRCVVEFDYHGARRRLRPYGIMLRQGFWYVVGFDETKSEERTYRVDRIEGGVDVGTAGGFERPAGVDVRSAFPVDPKQLGDSESMVARVVVDAGRATLVRRQLGEASVVASFDDGSIAVEVPCANVEAFRSWLFGWGSYVEVVEPASVREAVVDWLRSMVEQ